MKNEKYCKWYKRDNTICRACPYNVGTIDGADECGCTKEELKEMQKEED